MGKTFIGMATIDDSLNFEDGKLSLDYGTGLQIDSNKKVSIKKNTDSNNALIVNENGLYCDNVPIGGLLLWASNNNPNGRGWIICSGQAISRTTYAALYAVIGDTWGSGDGTNTFNVPNQMYAGNTRWLAVDNQNCGYLDQGLPNVTGYTNVRVANIDVKENNGMLSSWGLTNEWTNGWTGGAAFGGSHFGQYRIYANLQSGNSIYGAKGFVCPYTLKVKLFIKAFY